MAHRTTTGGHWKGTTKAGVGLSGPFTELHALRQVMMLSLLLLLQLSLPPCVTQNEGAKTAGNDIHLSLDYNTEDTL